MSDAPLRNCPECHETKLKKCVTAAAFKLKGTGWYETDFKHQKKPEKKAAGSKDTTGKKDATGSKDSGQQDSKSDSTTSTTSDKPTASNDSSG